MNRRTKLALAAVVLAAGAVLAWQFRKSGEPAAGNDELTGPFASPNRPAASGSPANAGEKTAQIGQPQPSSSPAARLVGASAMGTPDGNAGNSFASTDSRANTAGDAKVPELSAAFPAAASDPNRAAPIGAERPARPLERGLGFDDASPSRAHKLVDGDTLTQLSQRYLGSPDRWRELFDFNRDVLTDPELLPIGAELRIPTAPFRPVVQATPPTGSRLPATPAGSTTDKPAVRTISQPTAATVDGSSPESRKGTDQAAAGSPLAPVKGDPNKPSEPVKLQHLPPVAPVGHVLRVAPRTYVVQPGDTLNSIAEKLYGDGARETILREANRKVVPNPQDLRPGMVLVAPLDGQ